MKNFQQNPKPSRLRLHFGREKTVATSILGGNRQVSVRDGHSGTTSTGLVVAAINTTSSQLQSYGDTFAGGYELFYNCSTSKQTPDTCCAAKPIFRHGRRSRWSPATRLFGRVEVEQ